MQGVLDSSSIICDNDIPCMTDLNKRYSVDANVEYNSLTHLGNLSGAPDTNITNSRGEHDVMYGAEFVEANMDYPFYQTIVSQNVNPRWLSMDWEYDYMNRVTAKNRAPVKTYSGMIMTPIPDEKYEAYEPVINTKVDEPDNYPIINTCCGNNVINSKIKQNVTEPFQSSSELNIRGATDVDVGVSFIFKLMIIVAVFYVIYYFLKK